MLKALHIAGSDHHGRERWDAVARGCKDAGLTLPRSASVSDQRAAGFTVAGVAHAFHAAIQSTNSLKDCPLCPHGPVQITSATTWSCYQCGGSGNSVALAALYAFGAEYADPNDPGGLAHLREAGRRAHL